MAAGSGQAVSPKQRAEGRLKTWYRAFITWRMLHFVFGIGGILISTLIATDAEFLREYPNLTTVLKWSSAVTVALLTFLIPEKQALAYIQAWRVLDDAAGRYDNKEIDGAQLNDAIRAGERIIGQQDKPAA